MSKFKVGDRFKVISDHLSFVDVNIGDIVVLSKIEGDNCHLFYHQKTKSHVALFFHDVEIIDGSEYESSNRYKLQQAIKATGFHTKKLSLASNHAKTYFTGFTAESRFNSRGDITEDRLNSLLTTLAFAERELLGVGAKTVDDQVKPKDFGNRVENKFLNDEEIKLMDSSEYKNIADDFKSGMQESVVDSYIDPVETTQPKSSNFTKVGIIAIVILLLILWFSTR